MNMIHSHSELYQKLTSVQTFALWDTLYKGELLLDPPDPAISRGEVLAEKCSHLSHAEVVMAIANKIEPFWCGVIDTLLSKPMYLCARGETGVPLTDVEGRPLPLPIGHRRGEPAGTGRMPPVVHMRMARKTQYAKRVDPRVILSLKEHNPKTPGTKSYDRYNLYTLGMSVSAYVAIGGKIADIAHDVSKGYITVGMA